MSKMSAHVKQEPVYRNDIDGLRALAVLSVIIFHIDERIVPGGFIGVDIFFAISGYLISLHIFKDLAEGKFTLLEFYRRRVRRIIPAMLLVIFVTVAIAQLIMLPQDAEKVAESSLWSLISMANVYFWLFADTSYFAAASNEKPLLHLWSLGIEEQFYMIWPLILLVTYRLGHGKYFIAILSAVALSSFLLGDYLFSHDPSFVYYMLPTRAGELLLGGLLAHFILRNRSLNISYLFSQIASAVGLALIIFSLFLLSEEEVFPGVRAIPPTLGTVLLIFSGHYGYPLLNRLLGWRPIALIGLVSYSAYLWHWPLLAFYRYGYSEVEFMPGLVMFSLTFLLAWLSYRYVETPFRYSRKSPMQTFAYQFIIPAGLLGLLGIVSMKMDGYGLRWFSEDYRASVDQLRERNRPAYHYDYVCQSQVVSVADAENDNCIVNAKMGSKFEAATDVILWGDSNAAHYIGILGEIAKSEGFSFRNLQIGSCPPIHADSAGIAEPRRVSDCERSKATIFESLENHKIIIVSANWTGYQARSEEFLEHFSDTVNFLKDKGKNIIIIGKAPIIPSYDRLCSQKAISFPNVDCDVEATPLDEKIISVNEKLESLAARSQSVNYYDFNEYICNGGLCDAENDQGELMYYDSSHLTLDASWAIGQRLVEERGVPHPFNMIRSWLAE